MSDEKASTPTFETTVSQLEQIVAELENGQLDLDKSLVLFEQGVGLIKEGQRALAKAEQRVQTLSKQTDGGLSLSDFDDTATEQE